MSKKLTSAALFAWYGIALNFTFVLRMTDVSLMMEWMPREIPTVAIGCIWEVLFLIVTGCFVWLVSEND